MATPIHQTTRFSAGEYTACGRNIAPCSKLRATREWANVTCKLCLKKAPHQEPPVGETPVFATAEIAQLIKAVDALDTSDAAFCVGYGIDPKLLTSARAKLMQLHQLAK